MPSLDPPGVETVAPSKDSIRVSVSSSALNALTTNVTVGVQLDDTEETETSPNSEGELFIPVSSQLGHSSLVIAFYGIVALNCNFCVYVF